MSSRLGFSIHTVVWLVPTNKGVWFWCFSLVPFLMSLERLQPAWSSAGTCQVNSTEVKSSQHNNLLGVMNKCK